MTRHGATQLWPVRQTAIVGSKAISEYMGISERTLRRWVREQQFPVLYGNRRRLITSTAMIDCWLLDRMDVFQRARSASTPTKQFQGPTQPEMVDSEP